jgi:5-methylcytosine-specific restriction endonuclease McrA
VQKIQTETQKFLARVRKQAKRHAKRQAKAKRANESKAPIQKRNLGDGFYVCAEWRALRYLALRNCEGRCQCCGARAADGVQLHVDHIKPRATHPHLSLVLSNLQVLCADCNVGKGAWDDTDWREHWRSI